MVGFLITVLIKTNTLTISHSLSLSLYQRGPSLRWSITVISSSTNCAITVEFAPSSITFILPSLKYEIMQCSSRFGFFMCFLIPSPIFYSITYLIESNFIDFLFLAPSSSQHNSFKSDDKKNRLSCGLNPSFEYLVKSYPSSTSFLMIYWVFLTFSYSCRFNSFTYLTFSSSSFRLKLS